MNKINKQAEQNQRQGNKEQTDSDQRGFGREIWGKNRKGIVKEDAKDP